ncbi:uncharacterized protein EAF01_011286 [Botrytis porri]|uniref:Uncharacterized protein n=1 Tax=Botrytis porri TaxID=87229 RepID=A0A4Z1KJL8_9HELO|nr:uncharacterized protein EAF01_011286 [Botrytis porri]KAF7886608.1 hypothetical protein EAF01_011286 [Botrytis porri]TGO86283.1 hypothetical protein BPOR_0316g00010 [Botrytis porri]
MADSNMPSDKTEPAASHYLENDKNSGSDVSNVAQKSPQTPQSGPSETAKPAENRLAEEISHHRNALYYGPPDPDARFWGIIATSRRNRSVNRVSQKLQWSKFARNQKAKLENLFADNQIREPKVLSDVSSRDEVGKVSFEAEPVHLPESDITPTPSRHNTVTIVEVYELLFVSCAKLLARFRGTHTKKRPI